MNAAAVAAFEFQGGFSIDEVAVVNASEIGIGGVGISCREKGVDYSCNWSCGGSSNSVCINGWVGRKSSTKLKVDLEHIWSRRRRRRRSRRTRHHPKLTNVRT